MTVSRDGAFLDRRRVELVDDDLPAIPHHHEARLLPVEQGVALVERVRASAERRATTALAALAQAIPEVDGIALRRAPELPDTVAERIRDYRARNVADWVMYRMALAAAAQARGWRVHWYDAKRVSALAAQVLQIESFDAHFREMRKSVGAPWNNDHKLALAAAIAALTSP